MLKYGDTKIILSFLSLWTCAGLERDKLWESDACDIRINGSTWMEERTTRATWTVRARLHLRTIYCHIVLHDDIHVPSGFWYFVPMLSMTFFYVRSAVYVLPRPTGLGFHDCKDHVTPSRAIETRTLRQECVEVSDIQRGMSDGGGEKFDDCERIWCKSIGICKWKLQLSLNESLHNGDGTWCFVEFEWAAI